MTDRREFLIAGLAAGTLGLSEWLRPRQSFRLMPPGDLEKMLPRQYAGWNEYVGGNVVAPTTPNSLADRLYSAVVTRIYTPAAGGRPPIMLLIAYGGEQSDLLQLHRPEACYPAVGLEIVAHQLKQLPITPTVSVPGIYLSASNGDYREDIVYFTRLGEALPQTADAQRSDRLRAAMQGVTGDGVLVRASSYNVPGQPSWPYLSGFLASFILAMPPAIRRGLVGTRLATALQRYPAPVARA